MRSKFTTRHPQTFTDLKPTHADPSVWEPEDDTPLVKPDNLRAEAFAVAALCLVGLVTVLFACMGIL